MVYALVPTTAQTNLSEGQLLDDEGEEPFYSEQHMHPHPERKSYSTLTTVLRFTYDDNDPTGRINSAIMGY